jgi:hypothetical protein
MVLLIWFLGRYRKTGKKINVLYFGDFDPSGEDMDRHIRQSFATFGLKDTINFQRIAVTKEQIEKFNLPPVPDNQETLDKVNNDTRMGYIWQGWNVQLLMCYSSIYDWKYSGKLVSSLSYRKLFEFNGKSEK